MQCSVLYHIGSVLGACCSTHCHHAPGPKLSQPLACILCSVGDPTFRDAAFTFWTALQLVPNTDGLYCTRMDGDNLK
jgi:hypothetical protein